MCRLTRVTSRQLWRREEHRLYGILSLTTTWAVERGTEIAALMWKQGVGGEYDGLINYRLTLSAQRRIGCMY